MASSSNDPLGDLIVGVLPLPPVYAKAAWRPSEWAQPALTMITAPLSAALPGSTSAQTDPFGNPLPSAPQYTQAIYVFDAVLRAEHSQELRRTEHPIQTSASSPVASITDHAYQLPARVTLEIGMSDAMQGYSADMWWTGASSKSVNAYQILLNLLKQRTLVTLTTRLDTYQNMLVESIRPTETAKTLHGLRATVVFGQLFFAGMSIQPGAIVASTDDTAQANSARPQTTDNTPAGTTQPTSVPPDLTAHHSLPWVDRMQSIAASVPGAGNWSSTGSASDSW
jgi:hypothetical protein